MKLELTKKWFEKRIPVENSEVGAGLPERSLPGPKVERHEHDAEKAVRTAAQLAPKIEGVT